MKPVIDRKMIGVTGYPQARYGRGKSGRVIRSTMTPSTARNEQDSRANWINSSTASKLWVSSISVATVA